MSNPSDLNIVPQLDTDKNYFNFKAAGLKIDTNYAIKFQWVYEDGTLSEWSAGKFINTSTEAVPVAPSVIVPSTAIGNIPVTLSIFPANAKRVDVYIIGGVYGTGKVADSFFQAGTKNIPVTAGEYLVSLIAVTPSGINGTPTSSFTITISNAVTEDTTAPDPISAGVVTGGVHPQDSSGQLGYLNIAVTNATIPADFAGYIVKIASSTNTWTQEFTSSTALSSLYITGGLFVGQAYTLSVATTDGKNISSYVNCSPAPYTITDTRNNTSTVSGSLTISATDSILNVSWVASTDPYVDSYRVQITSNSDTNFASPLQTVNTKSTNTSFGGLTANTTYRIRVTTRYGGASGALSANHTSGTATLNASGAISDGNVPTKNPGTGTEPAIVVKPLFKAFTLNWSDIDNPDEVTYEVYVKTVNSTNIVDPANLVMEINGTFAVINSLKDGTAISYPAETSPTTATNYYFAVRAKDADGISSAAVTPVGPFTASRTGQFDIASNAIYANHITAGEITADKMTTDLLFVDKTINIGESTSLNRIRLASSITTPVIMTDPALASPSTYSVKSRIFIGAGNYYSSGTSFYADNTGRFSIGDKLRFDGTSLTINGSGTFTGTVTAGSGSNTVSIGNDVNSTNDGLYIGATGDYIYSDGRVRLGNGGITYQSGVLTVTGNITANSIASGTSISGTTGTFTGSITGASGTFGGALDVGTATLANITGASSVNVNSVTRVRFIAENALSANDVVTISGIAQNQTFAYWAGPGNTNPVYNYSNNPFNLGTVTVYEAGPTYFDIQSGVTGTYTSGGTAAGTAFRVTSTGIVRAAAGKIGGWTVDVTKLRSASGSISLDPITPQITIQGSGGYTGYNITLAAPTGITAGSTFSVTPAGYLTSTSGSIAGWNVTSSSISKAVSYTDIFGTSGTLTTTLGSNAKITVSSTNAPFGYFNSGIDSAIVTENANQKVEVGPNGVGFVNKTMNLGVQSGFVRMWTNSGDSDFNIYWDGWRTDPTAYTGATPETYAPFQWRWLNYSTSAERLTHIASITYDLLPQNLRPLVVDTDGRQYLGANSYFSTTQTTTPSAGTGSNGDLYYSTA
jgi:hypothetical protein